MNRQEKAEITKEKIIKAAMELSKEKVIQEINVEDITKRAGVSKGSFYTYFNKKEDVVDLFMYENWKELRQSLLESKEGKEDKLKSYIIQFASIIENKGKETCRSWIASNISNDYKLLIDEETLREILEDESFVKTINAFLYGLMLSWAMANDDRTLVSMTSDALPLIIRLIGE